MVARQRLLCSIGGYAEIGAFLLSPFDSITFLVACIGGIRYLHAYHRMHLASSKIPQTILPDQTAFHFWICDF